jgi:HupE / UreJ protein
VLVRVPLDLLLNLNLPKRGPGYLELTAAEAYIPKAIAATTKELVFLEDGRALTLAHGEGRFSQASDRSFESFERALALVRGPRLAPGTEVFWNQGYFDAYLEYAIASPGSGFGVDFSVAPALRERLKLDLRFVTPAGKVRAYEIPTGSGAVNLDPRWYQAAGSFVRSGFWHILDGLDHLLFLLCLVMPFRRLSWTLVGVITAFTVAHSITLIAAAYGLVPSGAWFPPLVEMLIAGSILYMAVENVVRPNLARRWMVTAIFGLVHGFGFSFLLQNQLQFAGEHLLLSLLAFNIGIELGQLLFISLVIPVIALALARIPSRETLITVVVSALVAHTAWHWLVERWEVLSKVEWPQPDPIKVLLWLLLAAALGALAWVLAGRSSQSRRREV